ncbi:hypothetical protein M752DRAFT_294389 [Aspergillus phoenicis ATCC 13157]|uniref:Dienelactone hydrolase domain-containing protein n=1 Tax=Aspergillus phoenicis ATCC 13157 TaxID=1353007 RepID=A0A370PH74_ASPPH|nr:hypothetical protein M752DRAFT_294389 [Aspergillus phoenicis ATCC 13157]
MKGEVADHSWVPPDTDEKMKAFSAFIEGPASIPDAAGVIPAILEDVMEKSGGKISRWAALGFCWGYKEYRTQVVASESGPGTPFVAAAVAHPSFLTPEDASKITIPFCILPSMNEDQEVCMGFEANLKVEKHIETFADMPHGWMAARGDLADAHSRAEFEREYSVVGSSLKRYLS